METTVLHHKKGMSTFDIKVLGIVLMVIDHIHQMFAVMGAPHWLDWFGRPVATIFFFVSAVGFAHTSNRKKYLQRLLFGYWIMNAGSFIVQKLFSVGDMALSNNIFADLFIAVLTMYGIELIKEGVKGKKGGKVAGGLAMILLPFLATGVLAVLAASANAMPATIFMMIVPNILMAENSLVLYLAVGFYLLRNHRGFQCLLLAVTAGLFAMSDPSALFTGNIQWMMIFAVIPMLLYNGEKGRGMRSFFYIFYPAHIWVLYIIASIVYTHFF